MVSLSATEHYLKIIDEIIDQVPDIPASTVSALMGYTKSIYRSELQNAYSEPMVYIGMYIALASLVCILAMVADLLHGLRSRRLWFPCKYFRVNAAFFSIIAVAMKLLVDLSGAMPGHVDQAAKLGSMAFMCTMMANLLPCLASMDNTELLSNITALSILVITFVVNVCIQIHTGVVSYSEYGIIQFIAPKYNVTSLATYIDLNFRLAIIYVALLILLLIVHVCSCLAILSSKKIIEEKYQQCHHKALKHIQHSPREILSVEKLQKQVINNWIMAGSGSPQFITACFGTTSASGVICVIVTSLHTLTMYLIFYDKLMKSFDSDYGSSMKMILIVQYIGVVIGTIAPLSRCFATLSFKVSFKIISRHFKVFEVESYWTRKLYDWKSASIKLPFRSYNTLKVVEILKKIILIICIKFQEGVVVVCKIISLIPFVFMICVLYCFRCLKWLLKVVFGSSQETTENLERNKDLRPYVLHLEDEMELAERTLEGLSESVNKMIQKGDKRQPNNLMKLIENQSSSGFHGVEKFVQSDQNTPTLQSKVQYQDCWSLTVVTLTTIAVSLGDNESESLLESVREGLEYVTRVEESLNVTKGYASLQNEAKILWKEVNVERKWLGHKLKLDTPSQVKKVGQMVEWFWDIAKNMDSEEDKSNRSWRNDDSIHRSICAKSMYYITKTIMHTYHDNIEKVSQNVVFDDLSSIIADIIAACLTNLPKVITMKCHSSEIEKREANVKDAARLLGETRRIIETLQRRDIPDIDPSDLPFLDKWRTCLRNP